MESVTAGSYYITFSDGFRWQCYARSRFEAAKKAQRKYPKRKIEDVYWA